MMRARIRLFRLLAPAALLACGDELGPRIPAAIVVTPEAPSLVTGGTLQLTATVVDASGEEVPGQDVSFRSSDPAFLTVDDAGLLTSSFQYAGSALITATSGELAAEVDVTVVLPASSVVGLPESLELNTFEVQFLSLTITDEDGEPVTDAPIGIQSSDTTVVRVRGPDNTPGVVQLTGVQVGAATVTVTSGARSAELPVTVGRFPSAVAITPSSLVLLPGGSQQLTVTLFDRASREIEGPHAVTWSSDDEAVVTVGANGLATATGPEGTARITATIGSLSGSIGVFVGTAPAGEVLARVPLAGAHGLAVSTDDRYFVTGSGTLASGALPGFAFPAELPIAGTLVDIALDASGSRAYVVRESGGSGPGVVVVDLTTNTEVDFIALSFGSPRVAALSADGSVLTVGTSLGLEVVDLAARRAVGIAVGRVRKIVRHPSRPRLYATGSSEVLELDDSSGEILRTFDGDAWSFTLTRDGTRLYIVGVDGGTTVWNLETGAQEPGLRAYGEDVAITPDGKFLYVLYPFPDDTRLFIHDAASGTLLRHIVLGGLAWRIAMSTDGIAVISNEGGAEGWVDFVR